MDQQAKFFAEAEKNEPSRKSPIILAVAVLCCLVAGWMTRGYLLPQKPTAEEKVAAPVVAQEPKAPASWDAKQWRANLKYEELRKELEAIRISGSCPWIGVKPDMAIAKYSEEKKMPQHLLMEVERCEIVDMAILDRLAEVLSEKKADTTSPTEIGRSQLLNWVRETVERDAERLRKAEEARRNMTAEERQAELEETMRIKAINAEREAVRERRRAWSDR